MRYLITFCLMVSPILKILASEDAQDIQDVSTMEGLPSSLVNNAVCVITGEYTDSVVDIVLPGPENLVLQRSYHSQSRGRGLGKAWSFNHGYCLILGTRKKEEKSVWSTLFEHGSGARIEYIYPKHSSKIQHKHVKFNMVIPKGLTNGASHLSGKANIKNQSLHYYPEEEKFISHTGAGDRRVFHKNDNEKDMDVYELYKEEKANGSVYYYDCKNKICINLSKIQCQSSKTEDIYSSIKFEPYDPNGIYTLKCSDGRKIKYHFHLHTYKVSLNAFMGVLEGYRKIFYLSKVDNPSAPYEHYEYEEKALNQELQLSCKKRPEGRFLKTEYYHRGSNKVGGNVGIIRIEDDEEYYLDRVRKLKAPVGTNKEAITTHRFVYRCNQSRDKHTGRKELTDGETDVYDAYDHKTRYSYDKHHRLTSILRYEGNSHYVPYSKESYVWCQESKQDGNLLGKILKDGHGNVHHARYFTYDERGNVLSNSLCGCLTGESSPRLILNSDKYPIQNGYECEVKTYTYSDDGLNLVLSETESNGKVTNYEYIKGRNHLKAKYVSYAGQIQLREFYFYDDHYVLIKKVTDNGQGSTYHDFTGVSERYFTYISPRQTLPLGLPAVVEEKYLDVATGEEKLIKKMICDYSLEGKLLKKEVYDANDHCIYALTYAYDEHGNLIRETNPLGEVIIKKYDANDNLIYQQGPSLDLYIQNTYDFANRLIRQEEIHTDGQQFVTSHTYNYLGQCISTINPYGQETRQVFDDLGRVIAVHYPAVKNENGEVSQPVVFRSYNIAGYPVCITDAKGRQTYTEYNSRGQPIKIFHPDLTAEQFSYSLDGQLIKKVEKNGTYIVYTRDALGRITEEIVYSSDGQVLKKKQQFYNALHLLKSIDEEGTVTDYSYDYAGRLISIQQGEKFTQNFYDSMGRLAEIREWFGHQAHEYRVTLKKYDLLDRTIEEHLQDSNGTILHFTRYAYDSRGNRTLEQVGEQQIWTKYNTYNQPIEITNALGHTTHTYYNFNFINSLGQRVLQTTTTDPLGYQTIDTYDSVNRLAETSRLNPFGIQVSHQLIYYDLCGNRCRLAEDVIQQGKIQKTIETCSNYALNNEILTLIEASGTPEQKITHSLYNQYGQKAVMIKPSGVQLFYEYDALGRLKILKASDDSIHYQYHYNLRDQVVNVADLKSGLITQRIYDQHGWLNQEILANGLNLSFSHDRTGRTTSIELPDRTSIEYVYQAVDLKEIHRLIEGKRIYAHHDLDHDLAGQILKVQLPGQNGQILYAYDTLGRCTEIKSHHLQQIVPSDGFDASGNLLKFTSQNTPYEFQYDDHYQIQSENGHVEHYYAFDSLFNRIMKDGELSSHNSLNQIVHKGQEQFIYDLNGNVIYHQKEGVISQYAYDALDRLISVSRNGKATNYIYDAFNRRISKQQEGQADQCFFYQGQEEIGLWQEGAIQELKIIGKNKRNPVVAIELKGVLYVPLQDLSGNVVCLCNDQGTVVEQYRYTVFGETEIFNSSKTKLLQSAIHNPWQYAGKRLDHETGLIAFGLRYYSSELGRWLTPDPAGFVDGSNLYAYVHNSPLLYYDEFGLYTNTAIFGLFGSSIFDYIHYNISTAYCGFKMLNQCIFGQPTPEIKHVEFEAALEEKYNFRASQNPEKKHNPLERTATYSLNGDERFVNASNLVPFKLKTSLNHFIGLINGIQNVFSEFRDSMIHLGNMSEYNIMGVHSASFGFFKDAGCYLQATRKYYAYEGVRELHKLWNHFFANASSKALLLMICHSRGAVYVRNALMDFPEELRNRIIVVAIAPGAYIDSSLCRRVTHYVSKADLVPLLDVEGRQRCKDTIVMLDPHPEASHLFDHAFTSKTYMQVLRTEINLYNNEMENL